VLRHGLAAAHDQARRIEEPAAAPGIGLRHAFRNQRGHDGVGNTDAGFTRAQEKEPVAVERHIRHAQRGVDAGEAHGAGALDVVIEQRHAVAEPRQQLKRVGRCEVLQLNQRIRKDQLNGFHEFVDRLGCSRSPGADLQAAQLI
jgi:hypothetical protein